MSADWASFGKSQKRPFADHRATVIQMAAEPHPGGLRIIAYNSLTPLLERMSFVKVREQKEPDWVLTPAGRRAVQRLGRDEVQGNEYGIDHVK